MKIETREIDIKRGIVQVTTRDERWYPTRDGKSYLPSSSWISSYYYKGKEFIKWLQEHPDDSEKVKEESGNRGSKVHQGIQLLLTCHKCHKPCVGKCSKGGEHVGETLKIDDKLPNSEGKMEEITVEEWECLIGFSNFKKKYNPTTISVEHTVFNEKDGYAGTLDWKVLINYEGVDYIAIIDHKTSKAIYPNHKIQLSSYKHAEGNEDVEKQFILQVGYKRNKEWFKFTEVEDCYNVFLATRVIWDNENKNVFPKQMEYPLSLKL